MLDTIKHVGFTEIIIIYATHTMIIINEPQNEINVKGDEY